MDQTEQYQAVPGFPFLDVRQYDFVRNIERSKSCVYLYRRGQQLLAVKQFKQVTEEELTFRIQLLHRLLQLNHPNIVQYRGLARLTRRGRPSEGSLLIFMDYYPKNLQQLLVERMHRRQYFTPEEVHHLLLQLIDPLEKLQSMGIAHRDIKPQNVLIDENSYRLCDFEDSLTDEIHGELLNVTTIEYSPLAMLHQLKSQQRSTLDPYKADVYSLGLTFLVVCSLGRFLPIERINYASNSKDHRYFMKQNRQKFVKRRYPSQINRMLKLMLEDDEYKREDFVTLRMKLQHIGQGSYTSEFTKSETTSASGSTRKSTNITQKRQESKNVRIHPPMLMLVVLLLALLIILCIY